jgi:hypothetical protein
MTIFHQVRFRPILAALIAVILVCGDTSRPARAADTSPNLGVGATFDSLQVGKTTYLRVLVRSVNARTLLISHAGGLASIRLRDLPPDLQAAREWLVAEQERCAPDSTFLYSRQRS